MGISSIVTYERLRSNYVAFLRWHFIQTVHGVYRRLIQGKEISLQSVFTKKYYQQSVNPLKLIGFSLNDDNLPNGIFTSKSIF